MNAAKHKYRGEEATKGAANKAKTRGGGVEQKEGGRQGTTPEGRGGSLCAVCCMVLQCVAVFCSVIRCVEEEE